MSISHSIELGAFSYAVSGFYHGVRIGRYCSFGEQVQIGRHGHPMSWPSTSPFFYERYDQILHIDPPNGISLDPQLDFVTSSAATEFRRTTIGNDVWIGHGSFIMPGVAVGDGACIGAMSVVTKDVPPFALVAGSPAVVKKMRMKDDLVERALALRWWEYAPWDLKGSRVDDASAFFNHVESLRSNGVSTFAPEWVDIASVFSQ